MLIDILICTIDEGVLKVPEVLMPTRDDVRYVVSVQWTREEVKNMVPMELREREDVEVVFLEGKGLSRNRNWALAHAKGDVIVIADDDNRYTADLLENVKEAYEAHPEADAIHFQALDLEGKPLHPYPADYVTSMEMTFRKNVKIPFDERFGLGSKALCAGEEQVWMKDAKEAGYKVIYVGKPIVMTRKDTTGCHFLTNKTVQISKGATFKYVYGTWEALWRSLKEAGWWMVHKGANPVPIFYRMLKGMVKV